jgi:hypothetical protein
VASDIKQKFGTSNQTITITLASLANSSARASTALDNSANLFLDALVFLKVKSNAAGVTATGAVLVYAFATADGGTSYTEGATGTDAAITLVSPSNLKLIGVVNVVAVGVTYSAGPFSVASAFGGTLPEKWGIVVVNKSGAALDASGHSAFYQGVLAQNV